MMHKEGLDKLPNPEAKGGYTLSRFIPIYTYNSTTISHFLSSVFKEQCMIYKSAMMKTTQVARCC